MAKSKVEPVSGMMNAAIMEHSGDPRVLRLERVPIPTLSPEDVLIAVEACGVGIWDADVRKGWWPDGRPRYPLNLGSDGAGVVAARGARVRNLRVGDRVWA